ncbi:hypothetical protein E2C01_083689 [Portunus trituberculatus]|uniref:Uncharacterized protein n=1 Tax=Portunus trituberculatus TaxID=210409 RepID=A0A5B7J779_PORTR|nr:hypothetical protein [Portunus trituberculatus]
MLESNPLVRLNLPLLCDRIGLGIKHEVAALVQETCRQAGRQVAALHRRRLPAMSHKGDTGSQRSHHPCLCNLRLPWKTVGIDWLVWLTWWVDRCGWMVGLGKAG